MWIDRLLATDIAKARATRPVVLLTGARQTGKSSLLRHLLPDAEYVTFDRIALATAADEGPERFFHRFPRPPSWTRSSMCRICCGNSISWRMRTAIATASGCSRAASAAC